MLNPPDHTGLVSGSVTTTTGTVFTGTHHGVQRDPGWVDRLRLYTVTPRIMAEISKLEGSTVFLPDLRLLYFHVVL